MALYVNFLQDPAEDLGSPIKRLAYVHLPFDERGDLQHELDFLVPVGNCREWGSSRDTLLIPDHPGKLADFHCLPSNYSANRVDLSRVSPEFSEKKQTQLLVKRKKGVVRFGLVIWLQISNFPKTNYIAIFECSN